MLHAQYFDPLITTFCKQIPLLCGSLYASTKCLQKDAT